MATTTPRRRPPSPLLLFVAAAVVIVAIFLLRGMEMTTRSTGGGPTDVTASDAVPAGQTPTAPPTEDPERPHAPREDRAPTTEAPEPTDAAPKPIPGGAGLPPVHGMDEPAAPEAPPAAQDAPPTADDAGAEPDEDAERLVYAPDREGIQTAIGGEKEHLRECYEAWLQADPALGGKVKVQFVISDPDSADDEALARISGVKILGTTLTGESAQFIEGCVMNVMSSLRFDPPAGGTLTVNYPFAFRSEDQR